MVEFERRKKTTEQWLVNKWTNFEKNVDFLFRAKHETMT